MSVNRIEGFADGVFAIAATLLILNVDAQVGEGAGDLGPELLHAWPSYIGYAVSFVTIGVIWVNHHTMMSLIARTDRIFSLLTVGFLMSVAFIPFPTRLVAEHIRSDDALAATLAYGLTLTVTALFFNALWLFASRRRRLLRDDVDEALVVGITRSYRPGAPMYLTATLVGIASPEASAVLYGAIAVFYVIESSLFGRRRARSAAAS